MAGGTIYKQDKDKQNPLGEPGMKYAGGSPDYYKNNPGVAFNPENHNPPNDGIPRDLVGNPYVGGVGPEGGSTQPIWRPGAISTQLPQQEQPQRTGSMDDNFFQGAPEGWQPLASFDSLPGFEGAPNLFNIAANNIQQGQTMQNPYAQNDWTPNGSLSPQDKVKSAQEQSKEMMKNPASWENWTGTPGTVDKSTPGQIPSMTGGSTGESGYDVNNLNSNNSNITPTYEAVARNSSGSNRSGNPGNEPSKGLFGQTLSPDSQTYLPGGPDGGAGGSGGGGQNRFANGASHGLAQDPNYDHTAVFKSDGYEEGTARQKAIMRAEARQEYNQANGIDYNPDGLNRMKAQEAGEPVGRLPAFQHTEDTQGGLSKVIENVGAGTGGGGMNAQSNTGLPPQFSFKNSRFLKSR